MMDPKVLEELVIPVKLFVAAFVNFLNLKLYVLRVVYLFVLPLNIIWVPRRESFGVHLNFNLILGNS